MYKAALSIKFSGQCGFSFIQFFPDSYDEIAVIKILNLLLAHVIVEKNRYVNIK